MFIKKFVKENKTYYLLTFVFQKNKDEKPEFKKCFIPEALALWLANNGVEIKNNEEKK